MRGEIGGVAIGEARAVDRERAGRLRGFGIAGLGEHPLDPEPDLRLGIGASTRPATRR